MSKITREVLSHMREHPVNLLLLLLTVHFRRGAEADPIPAFVTEARPVSEWVKPVADNVSNILANF